MNNIAYQIELFLKTIKEPFTMMAELLQPIGKSFEMTINSNIIRYAVLLSFSIALIIEFIKIANRIIKKSKDQEGKK